MTGMNNQNNAEFDADGFRRALGQYGTGVTVVTTSHDGIDYGLTSNSFASVSLAPPLILWSIKKNSQSYRAFMECGHFTVNVLARSQSPISDRFAKSGGDKFAGLDITRGLGGAPVLPGSVAIFECSAASRYDGGDHTIILGKVERFSRFDRQALLFSQGQYATADQATFMSALPFSGDTTGSGSAVGHHTLATALRLAYGALLDRLRVARTEVRMTHPQAAIVNALLQKPNLTVSEVAARLGFGLNSSELEFDSLIEEGLVARGSDGRMALTDLGTERTHRLRERASEIEAAALHGFAPQEVDLLRRMLDQLIRN